MLKLLGAVSGILWIPLIVVGLHLSGFMAFIFIGVLWGASFMFPDNST